MTPEEAIYQHPYYSIRRYYVDKFLLKSLETIPLGSKIIDLGGVKYNRRGVIDLEFEIMTKKLEYDCANLSSEKKPEILCNINSVPRDDSTYDVAILSEVLEHISDPACVLKEANRLLKTGGKIFICTPYFFHVHPDPKDYARYSPDWYFEKLEEAGFSDILIVPQGTVFMVLLNIIKLLSYELEKKGKFTNLFTKIIKKLILKSSVKIMFYLDKKYQHSNIQLIKYSTTGFAVSASKVIL